MWFKNVTTFVTLKHMIITAIVEDDKDISEGISQFLNQQAGISCPIAEESVENLFHTIAENAQIPDVIIMDIGLPGISGIEGIRLLKNKYPQINIIMFTIHDDHDKIFQSLCSGASGYLLKNTPLPEIRDGIKLLYEGGAPMSPQIAKKTIDFFSQSITPAKEKEKSVLTEREKEIVSGLVEGLTYQHIADQLFISIETVRYHIKNIYHKLHVNCKAEVITRSIRGEI